jgi:hypothetical protein
MRATGFLCLLLSISFVSSSVFAENLNLQIPDHASCESYLNTKFGLRVRTRDNGLNKIVFSPKGAAERTNNSTGFAVSSLDQNEIRQALAELSESVGEGNLQGDLALNGLELYNSQSKEFVSQVESTLGELGLNGKLRVVPIYRPGGEGLRYALGRLRAVFPLAQDYEKPVRAEVSLGAPGTLVAESTTIAYAFSHFPPQIAVPLSIGHFGLLGSLSAFSRTSNNWMNRSQAEWEKLTKDFMLGNLFILNYDINANWPKIMKSFADNGMLNPDIISAVKDYVVHQAGVTGVTQTLFFYTTFINGLWRWQAIITRKGDPALADKARNAGAILQPMIFAFSGPMLNWASTSQEVAFHIGSFGINPGQVGLACLAATGCIATAFPEQVFTPLIEPLNRYVYVPLTTSWDKMMSFFKRSE